MWLLNLHIQLFPQLFFQGISWAAVFSWFPTKWDFMTNLQHIQRDKNKNSCKSLSKWGFGFRICLVILREELLHIERYNKGFLIYQWKCFPKAKDQLEILKSFKYLHLQLVYTNVDCAFRMYRLASLEVIKSTIHPEWPNETIFGFLCGIYYNDFSPLKLADIFSSLWWIIVNYYK